jgi:hypothetical protein
MARHSSGLAVGAKSLCRRFFSANKATESKREFQERTLREINFYKRMGFGGMVLMIASTGLSIYASQTQIDLLKQAKQKKETLEIESSE